MTVQARFYVASITHTAYGAQRGAVEVKLQAVSRGDQNRQWAAATPSGVITMQVNNEPAAKWFTDMLGQDVDIVFSAPTVLPGDGHQFRAAEVPEHHYLKGMCGECGLRPEDHPSK